MEVPLVGGVEVGERGAHLEQPPHGCQVQLPAAHRPHGAVRQQVHLLSGQATRKGYKQKAGRAGEAHEQQPSPRAALCVSQPRRRSYLVSATITLRQVRPQGSHLVARGHVFHQALSLRGFKVIVLVLVPLAEDSGGQLELPMQWADARARRQRWLPEVAWTRGSRAGHHASRAEEWVLDQVQPACARGKERCVCVWEGVVSGRLHATGGGAAWG